MHGSQCVVMPGDMAAVLSCVLLPLDAICCLTMLLPKHGNCSKGWDPGNPCAPCECC